MVQSIVVWGTKGNSYYIFLLIITWIFVKNKSEQSKVVSCSYKYLNILRFHPNKYIKYSPLGQVEMFFTNWEDLVLYSLLQSR